MPLLSCQLITPWANNNDNFAAVVAAYPRFPWDRGTICEGNRGYSVNLIKIMLLVNSSRPFGTNPKCISFTSNKSTAIVGRPIVTF